VNGTPPEIEIFKPFEQAIEVTRQVLFRPFDFAKWCVIGFAAFLAGGTNFSFGFRLPLKGANWNVRSSGYTSPIGVPLFQSGHVDWWLVTLIAALVLIVLAIVVVLWWVRARGAFIFTDCIVRNRAAIVESWKEFRREGNSLFIFSSLVALVFLIVVAIASVAFVLPLVLANKRGASGNIGAIAGLVLACTVIFFAAAAWAVTSHFMVPIMYRRRCRAGVALRESVSLITAYPAPIILYLLFLIVLAIAAAMIACITVCLTCCIAALPYVGTVILLPVLVLLRSFLFLFLRQFGPEYDVWKAIPQPEPPALPASSEPPPLPV
jgi:hypothetical protein